MGIFKASAPPPPPLPPPPPSSRQTQPPWLAASKNLTHQSNALPLGSFAVGVETEFLIVSRDSNARSTNIETFSCVIARKYMQYLEGFPTEAHPAMHNAINEPFHGVQYSQWSLDKDSTIVTPSNTAAPWGLEVISPIFRVHPGSSWRSHILLLWNFLAKHYVITANSSCGTHVHVSKADGYSLDELKRIGSSIIHFEPAFEALLPKDRLGNEYTKSNWIDNKNFKYKNLSRLDCIAMINQCTDVRSLVLLMNPDNEGEHDKMFGWNFLNLLQNTRSTIEFRRGAPSTSAQYVLMLIEVAISFVHTSTKIGTHANLQRVPGTVGGLKWFIEAAKLPQDLHDSRYLNLFFGQTHDELALEPTPVGRLTTAKALKLKKKKLEDKQRNIMLAKTLNPPYWS